MAALYGRMQGNRGEATRMGTANSGIHATLETWQGAVRTELDADGTFRVWIGPKHAPSTLLLTGNVNDRTVTPEDAALGEAA